MMFNIDLTGRKTKVTAVRVNSHGAVLMEFVALEDQDRPVAQLVLAVPGDTIIEIVKQLHGKLPGVAYL